MIYTECHMSYVKPTDMSHGGLTFHSMHQLPSTLVDVQEIEGKGDQCRGCWTVWPMICNVLGAVGEDLSDGSAGGRWCLL